MFSPTAMLKFSANFYYYMFMCQSDQEMVEDINCLNTELTKWLKGKVIETIDKIENDQSEYNRYINKNLPYN